MNPKPMSAPASTSQRVRPASTARMVAYAAPVSSRVSRASGLLKRNISVATGVTAMTAPASSPAAGENQRRTQSVEDAHGGHALEGLGNEHAPRVEAEDAGRQLHHPQRRRRLVDGDEVGRVERAEEERLPALRARPGRRRSRSCWPSPRRRGPTGRGRRCPPAARAGPGGPRPGPRGRPRTRRRPGPGRGVPPAGSSVVVSDDAGRGDPPSSGVWTSHSGMSTTAPGGTGGRIWSSGVRRSVIARSSWGCGSEPTRAAGCSGSRRGRVDVEGPARAPTRGGCRNGAGRPRCAGW